MSEARVTPTPSRRTRRARVVGGVFAALGLVILLACAGTWLFLFRGSGVDPGMPVEVRIPDGAGTKVIAERLADKGVIGNANLFRLRARADGVDGKLKAGTYDFVTGMDYETVVDRLEEGPPQDYAMMTVPEGFTVAQIAERVAAKTEIPAKDFERVAGTQAKKFRDRYPFLRFDPTDSLEGYLFPKTYKVRKDAKPEEIVGQMLDQFQKETAGLDLGYAASRNLSLHDVVTIASMVERETKLPKERPLVASVIYNRLHRDMRLEIDATIQYIVGYKPRLLYRDLAVRSPYNTYLNRGLPPGAIASPGLPSLEAAAHPADTGYLYYVLTSRSGAHTFTSTKEAFLRAKERGVR